MRQALRLLPATLLVAAMHSVGQSGTPSSAKLPEGSLVWSDGTRYVGGVVDGKREGKGTVYWPDGTRFTGIFKNDLREGPGTLVLPDGTMYNGVFRNDQLVSSAAPPQGAASAEPGPEGIEYDRSPEHDRDTDERAILDALKRWQTAWSTTDIDGYLASYGDDFDIPGDQDRSQWRGWKRSRLERAGYIEVTVEDTSVTWLSDEEVRVRFLQTYRSDRYSDVTEKALHFRRYGDSWLISREISLKNLGRPEPRR